MTRYEQYKEFNEMVVSLLLYAKVRGFPIRLGEAHRPQMVADDYAKRGVGIKNSKHIWSLALDVWLATGKTGKGIGWVTRNPTKPENIALKQKYEDMGRMWKKLGGTWGGDFKKYDCYHFELKGKVA